VSGHPMLQPTSWGENDTPQAVASRVSKGQGRVYELVWHTALACTMRPPVLQHYRWIWRLEDVLVAAAARSPVPGQEGYWLERKDWPRSDFPTQADVLPGRPHEALMLGVWAEPVPPPTVGEFIEGIAQAGLVVGYLSNLAASNHPLTNLQGRVCTRPPGSCKHGLAGNSSSSFAARFTRLLEAVHTCVSVWASRLVRRPIG
jgi:hypothetical protein